MKKNEAWSPPRPRPPFRRSTLPVGQNLWTLQFDYRFRSGDLAGQAGRQVSVLGQDNERQVAPGQAGFDFQGEKKKQLQILQFNTD